MRQEPAPKEPTPKYTISLEPEIGWTSWSSWLPEADTTFTFTASTNITANKGKIVFSLTDVTEYDGWYMNDIRRGQIRNTGKPNEKPHKGPDIRFASVDKQDTHAHDGQGNQLGKLKGWTLKEVTNDDGSFTYTATAEWSKRPVETPDPFCIDVQLECWDYAAYGVIQAELQKRKWGLWSTKARSASHTIPLDNLPRFGANKIADAWERDNGAAFGYLNTSQDCDSGGEKIDPNTQNGIEHGQNNGDGFSIHEEYRGFTIKGVHTRLDPRVKDLFIYSAVDVNAADFVNSNHLRYVHNLPMISVHEISLSDQRNKAMNFAREGVPSNGKLQHIIIVETGDNPPTYLDENGDPYQPLGETIAELHDGGHGQCVIYHPVIDDSFNSVNAKLEVFDTTVAHEVGHSIGLALPAADGSSNHDDAYDGLPAVPPQGEACVMIGGGFDEALMLAWQGTGFADFHDDTVHPDHSGWEDHWGIYKLHNHHGEHCSYSKGVPPWSRNL